MVLSWSRMLYIEFVWETHEAILQRCHMNAFDYFQGVPKRILYDNMKTVAIGRRENGQVEWNTKFLDFAQHYGFEPRVHRPRSPKTKGKVERPMGYIRGNFFQGISFSSLRDLNVHARALARSRGQCACAWHDPGSALGPVARKGALGVAFDHCAAVRHLHREPAESLPGRLRRRAY
jgi:transposase